MSDLRHAVRVLLRNRSFAAVAILTLALGIGANTAIFSIINTVLLKPFSYRAPDRIMTIWETMHRDAKSKWRVAPANFLDWQQQNTHFERVAAFGAASLNLTGGGAPEQLNGAHVTVDYFQVLGMEPILGRSFLPDENIPGEGTVVILSHGLWQRRFGGEKGIIGQSIELDGTPYTVLGVMPDGIYPSWPQAPGRIQFQPDYHQFWIPTSMTPAWKANRGSHVLGVIGRLKQEATIAQAQSEMDSIARALESQYSQNEDEGVLVAPFVDEVVGNVRPALLILLCSVGFVLLIACANVASLLLARLASRSREISIRAAIGASKLDLLRQFLLEGFLLVFLGGTIGIWLAPPTVNLLVHLIPQQIPRLNHVAVDYRVLGFTFVVCLLTSIVFGLIMAVHSFRANLVGSLNEAARGSSEGKKGRRFQQVLVIVQLSIAVLLVLGAGLLVRSFWRLREVNPGFNPQRLLIAEIVLPGSRYSAWPQINNFYSQLVERIRKLPGVQSAAIGYDHPLESNWINSFKIEGSVDPSLEPSGRFITVSPDYFTAAGIELVKGRVFTEDDNSQHPGAVIINEALARQYFPNGNVLGEKLGISPPSWTWGKEMPESFQIVGVVRDVRFLGLDTEPEPAYYVPAAQSPFPDMKLLVRTQDDPQALAPAIRDLLWSLDPNQPIARVSSMEQIVARSLAGRRFNMTLMGLFGLIALVLASVGVYGLFSYSVTLRISEFGIRLALGARPGDIFRMVLGHSLALSLSGVAIGLAAAALLTRYLSSQLYGITATDPLSYAAVAILLPAIALLACYIPARRAMRVDPIQALHYE